MNMSNTCQNENDLLDVNMQSISNELDALVGNELDLYGEHSQHNHQQNIHISSAPALNLHEFIGDHHPLKTVVESLPTTHVRPANTPAVCAKTQPSTAVQYNYNAAFNVQQLMSHSVAINAQSFAPVYIPGGAAFPSALQTVVPPKVNFQYLRSFNKQQPGTEAVPLLSAAVNQSGQSHAFSTGATRKYQKPYHKYRETIQHEEIDYDKIVVDLSLIGLSTDGTERNDVIRLFGCFRQVHYYLNDVIPSPYAMHTCDNISLMPPVRASMPATMNVQQQVKQALRKCNIFIGEMERILNANKLFDRELYMECERSVNMLRQMLLHFEPYKRAELEHKRGQFVNEESRVQAERLELLIQQLCDRIREVHVYVIAFNWFVDQKRNPPTQQQLVMRHQRLQAALYEQQRKAMSRGIWDILEPKCDEMTENADAVPSPTAADTSLLQSTEIETERELLRNVG